MHHWQRTLSLGCALFTMLFGAGNIIFPLILGRTLGSSLGYAVPGLILSGVLIPMIGFLAIMRSEGDYAKFLNPLGKLPAFLVALLCMGLLGPLGAIPRCMAIAYADLAWYVPSLSMPIYSCVSALLLWFLARKPSRVTNILGRILGPLKILCLLAIAILGNIFPGNMQDTSFTPLVSFFKGLEEGYSTMDLLAILFFSPLIFAKLAPKNLGSKSNFLRETIFVSLISGCLMTVVYIGFSTVSARHSSIVAHVANDTLLSALASFILGRQAGLFANLTIILTCLTTALALTTTFAEFLSNYASKNRIPYSTTLIVTVVSSALIANLKFSGIMSLILPGIVHCYPALTLYCVFALILTEQPGKALFCRLAFFLMLGGTIVRSVFQ